MDDLKNKSAKPLIDRVEIESKPGAKVVVKRLRLTAEGREVLMTGSGGIDIGVSSRDFRLFKKRTPEPA